MNYIEVTLGGKVRGLKFNTFALEAYADKVNFQAVGATAIYGAFYAGLCGNCYVKDVDPDFTFEQVCDWVDEVYATDKKTIEKVCNLFADTQVYKSWLQDFQEKVRTILDKPADKKKARVK